MKLVEASIPERRVILDGLSKDVRTAALGQLVAQLGQPLYGNPEPTGYPNTTEVWASSASILGRMQFASALVSDQIPGVAIDADALTPFRGAMRAASELFGASTETLQLIEKQLSANAPPTTLTALLLGSPDFQRK